MNRKQLIGYTLILFLLAYWIASEVFYARGNSPVGSQYQRDGQTFHHLYKRGPHLPWILAFPSSPPVYVFDSSGAFVEWSRDPGDDTRYQQRWPSNEGLEVDQASLKK